MELRSRLDPNGAYEEAHQYVKRCVECLSLKFEFCQKSDAERLAFAKKTLSERSNNPISNPTDEQATAWITSRTFPTFHGYVPVRNDETVAGRQRAVLRGDVATSAAMARSYCVFAQSTDAEFIQSFNGSTRLFTPFVLEFRVRSSARAAEEVRNCSASALANMNLGGRLASIIDEYDAPFDPDQIQTGYVGYGLEVEIR